jgi:hypothetical protein
MGLTNAPAVFQAEMNKLFGPHLNTVVCIYLGAILVFSQTEADHLKHLRLVLDCLKASGLKAKLSKCEFFKRNLRS